MAGPLQAISSNQTVSQWEIHFSRFFNYPSRSSPCSNLIPLSSKMKTRPPKGTWISSSSSAILRLFRNQYGTDVSLAVCLSGKTLEEHYISKLNFSWPQVSCVPGYPARGIRAVLVSYRDAGEEIQKFALRFESIHEAERFINTLKMMLKDIKDNEPSNMDFGSEISSQSEFMSSNKLSNRASEELRIMPHIDAYTPHISPRLINEIGWQSRTQEKEASPGQNSQGISTALPPSFTSLVMNYCSVIDQGAMQPTNSREIDLKSQIAKYMGDSSFQDMLMKVEKIISEMGGDMTI